MRRVVAGTRFTCCLLGTEGNLTSSVDHQTTWAWSHALRSELDARTDGGDEYCGDAGRSASFTVTDAERLLPHMR
jgi:hypothetical protein